MLFSILFLPLCNYNFIDAYLKTFRNLFGFFLFQKTNRHISSGCCYNDLGNVKELVNGTFDGLEFVNTFNGNNLPFYKKIAFFNIDAFLVNAIAVTMIAEIRTDQYIYSGNDDSGNTD